MKKPITMFLIIIGVVFIALGVYYFVTPAGSLASWAPGHAAGSTHTHFKHGLAATLLGLGSWVLAWFSLGAKCKSSEAQV